VNYYSFFDNILLTVYVIVKGMQWSSLLDFQRNSSVRGLLVAGPKRQEESGQMNKIWIFVMTCVALSYAGMA